MLLNPLKNGNLGLKACTSRSAARKYSLLDRSRYYWPEPVVQRVLIRLMNNLRNQPIPLSLLHQFFPEQVSRIRRGLLTNDPEALIKDKIKEVLRDYSSVTRGG